MALNRDILEEFTSITGFDVLNYFNDFETFIKTDYNSISDYFSGNTENINTKSFDNLNKLLKSNDEAFYTFTQFKDRLYNLKWWDLMLQLEEIDSSLLTIKNLSKWLRSSKTNTSYSKNQEIQLGLNQSQTLENLNKDVLLEKDYQNSWVDSAIRNNIKEEDYDFEGGNLLSVSFSNSGQVVVNGVVDNISGENILGIDLDKKTAFENNDLKVLSYSNTFLQSILILSSLKTNDNPYLANNGVDSKSIVGSNINLINLPLIFRQISEVFSTDDTIDRFSLSEVVREQDGLFAKFSVMSKLNQLDTFKIKLGN